MEIRIPQSQFPDFRLSHGKMNALLGSHSETKNMESNFLEGI